MTNSNTTTGATERSGKLGAMVERRQEDFRAGRQPKPIDEKALAHGADAPDGGDFLAPGDER